jgi:hypothetical protein
MSPEISIILAVGIPLLGLAATWGSLGTRIRQLEKEVAKIETLQTGQATLDAKIEHVRNDQGKRLGGVEQEQRALAGQFEGFKHGFGAGRRSRTAAQGIPIAGAKDES